MVKIAKKNKLRTSYMIVFKAIDTKTIIDIISKYIIPSFKYKI